MSTVDFGEQISFGRWRVECLKGIAEDFRQIGDTQRCTEALELAHRLERELNQISTLARIIHAIDRQAEAWECDNADAIDAAEEDNESLEVAHIAIGRNASKGRTSIRFGVKPIA